MVTLSLSWMCGFKYGDKGAYEPQSCFIPYLIISSLMQIWWVFTVVSETKFWLPIKSTTSRSRSKINFSDSFDVSSGPPARRVGAGIQPQPEGHRRWHGWTLWPQVNTKYHPFYDLCTYVLSTYYDIRILNIYLGIGTRLPRSQTWCARSKRQINWPGRQFVP